MNDLGLPELVENQENDFNEPRKGQDHDKKQAIKHDWTPEAIPLETHLVILRRAFDREEPETYAKTASYIKASAAYFGIKIGDNKAKDCLIFYIQSGYVSSNSSGKGYPKYVLNHVKLDERLEDFPEIKEADSEKLV